MVDLIRVAYFVEADKVLGGPTWLELDRFDVIARVPENATRQSVGPLLQALLADRLGSPYTRTPSCSWVPHSRAAMVGTGVPDITQTDFVRNAATVIWEELK